MSEKKSFVYGLDNISKAVQYLKEKFKSCKVFAFYGPLGAGKTTLARALLRDCDISEAIASPTFTYLNLYKNNQGCLFYHFDLYRLASLNDFLALGFDEYLNDERGVSLIEWPEIIEPLLKHNVCRVVIDYHQDPEKRVLTCNVIE